MKQTIGAKVMAVAVGVAVAFLAGGAGEALAGKKVAKKQVTGVVNLNTGTPQQLDLLPGVGETATKRIVEYRKATPFKQPEELVRVKGFGKKKLEKLKPFLTVSGPTTLKVIAAAPGQGESAAAAPKAQGRLNVQNR